MVDVDCGVPFTIDDVDESKEFIKERFLGDEKDNLT